jgi:hypothetical protein
MCSSAHHVIMIIACHRIRCTVCIFIYTLTSYRMSTLLHSYPIRFRIEYYLSLLRPVAIGDFRSPAIVGSYWNILAMEWRKS